ncbi:MAG: radical SAM family heme chaperone HemW [Gammaproteobacteria bacterium]
MGDINFTALPPLTLYIHIPWCVKKCPYCDFNSHVAGKKIPEERYIDVLLADIESELAGVWGRTVESIFIGGGTPSLFSAPAIDRLLSGLRTRLPLKPGLEITLEANPGAIDQERFDGFRKSGINRLSIGVQSFQNTKLQALGRIHNSTDALFAMKTARAAGFDNINLDLMFGLPDQTTEDALQDLEQAMALNPAHISWYQLTLEPNTLFYQQRPILPDQDTLWDMQISGQNQLARQGYEQYEVSAYAKKSQRCHHNENYWEFGDYIGIGAGAHGKISDAASQSVRRTIKQRHPTKYLEANQEQRTSSSRLVSSQELVFEYALNRFRLTDPIQPDEFSMATGLPDTDFQSSLQTAIDMGFLTDEKDGIVTTRHGHRFLDDLVAVFLQDA